MSNASNLLPVFSCSAIIKVENSPEYCLNYVGETVIRLRKSHNSRLFCALVQRVSLPYLAFSSNPASSLSMGPQHLFPLLCRNFLYLARSWAVN